MALFPKLCKITGYLSFRERLQIEPDGSFRVLNRKRKWLGWKEASKGTKSALGNRNLPSPIVYSRLSCLSSLPPFPSCLFSIRQLFPASSFPQTPQMLCLRCLVMAVLWKHIVHIENEGILSCENSLGVQQLNPHCDSVIG